MGFWFREKFPSSSCEVFEPSREAELREKRGSARGNEREAKNLSIPDWA